MEVTKVSQITDDLKKYTYGEGYDININGKLISLSNDELEAINYLTLVMRFENKNNG